MLSWVSGLLRFAGHLEHSCETQQLRNEVGKRIDPFNGDGRFANAQLILELAG